MGNKFADMKNDIARGNEPRHGFSDICEEYKLMMHLVYAVGLMRPEIQNEDIVRLLGYKY